MAQVVIYARDYCGYCLRAKALLERKGVLFEEFDVWDEPAKFDEMIERAGGRMTVPQIFIGGRHVGGSDELSALDRSGKLDALLDVEATD
jgi:glutaredoxin 3